MKTYACKLETDGIPSLNKLETIVSFDHILCLDAIPYKPTMDKDFYLKADDFFLRNCPNGLTFDDLSLATCYSEVLPRDVNLETQLSDSMKLSLPILSSDMDLSLIHI